MKKECSECGKQYTGRRKIEHIKKSHRRLAYELFIKNYINGNYCFICKKIIENRNKHILQKHLGRVTMEYSKVI